MLICGECEQPLTRALDATSSGCAKCGTTVVSMVALERWLRDDAATKLREQLAIDDARPGAGCPACRGTMRALELTLDALVIELDLCAKCKLFQLDQGEFEQLPRKALRPRLSPAAARREIAKAKVRLDGSRWRYLDDYELTWPQRILGWIGLPVDVDAPVVTTPWATWSVAAAVVVCFFFELADADGAIETFGWIPAHPFRLGGLTLVTPFFLHAGWLHLLGNLYFLVTFGPGVESKIGRARLLVLLLVATVVGNLLHALVDPRKEAPCVGASGGLSGLILFYAATFPRNRFTFILMMLKRVSLSAPAWAAFWFLWQCFTAFLQFSGATRVSALAHLGGALSGLALFFLWRRPVPQEA